MRPQTAHMMQSFQLETIVYHGVIIRRNEIFRVVDDVKQWFLDNGCREVGPPDDIGQPGNEPTG